MQFVTLVLVLGIPVAVAIGTMVAWKSKDLSPIGKFGRFMQITGILALLICIIYFLLTKTR